jgi:hypothetical protein
MFRVIKLRIINMGGLCNTYRKKTDVHTGFGERKGYFEDLGVEGRILNGIGQCGLDA